MAKRKKWRAYVIFAAPDQYGRGRPSHYFDQDGKITEGKKKAARFVTHGDAVEFAKAKSIVLNDATQYIGQEEFDT